MSELQNRSGTGVYSMSRASPPMQACPGSRPERWQVEPRYSPVELQRACRARRQDAKCTVKRRAGSRFICLARFSLLATRVGATQHALTWESVQASFQGRPLWNTRGIALTIRGPERLYWWGTTEGENRSPENSGWRHESRGWRASSRRHPRSLSQPAPGSVGTCEVACA